MLRLAILLVTLSPCHLVTLSAARADDPVFSGPQPGEKLTGFKVQQVFGPAAGKEIDPVAELKGGPTVLVFVHELTRPGRQLLLPIEAYGNDWSKDGLATHFIWLTADKAKTEEFLKTAQASIGIKAPIGISVDGLEGPGNYGLNRKMTFTILVAKDNKVVANHAIIQPNETDAPKVLADVAKMLGKAAPMADEVRKRAGGPGRQPVNADEPEGAQRIKESMRPLLKETDKEKIAAAFQRLDEWAGRDRKKATWLRGYLELIFEKSKYGTDEVKEGYRTWKKSKEEKQ